MDGKYNPMAVSRTKNAPNDEILKIGEANGPAVTAHMAVQAAKMVADVCKVCPGVQSLAKSFEKKLEPIIMQTMKHEKIMPNGTSLSGTSITGVQRNTKMYMQLSMMLWTMPIHKTGRLDTIRLKPSL
jgi:hypothetical protein